MKVMVFHKFNPTKKEEKKINEQKKGIKPHTINEMPLGFSKLNEISLFVSSSICGH